MENIRSDTEVPNNLNFIVIEDDRDLSADNSRANNVEIDATDRKSRRKDDNYSHSHRSRHEQVRSHSDRYVGRKRNRLGSRESRRSNDDSSSRKSGRECDPQKVSDRYVPRRHSEDYRDKRSKREIHESRRDTESTEKKNKEADKALKEKNVKPSQREKRDKTKNEELKCKEQEVGEKVIRPVTDKKTQAKKGSLENKKENTCDIVHDESTYKEKKIKPEAKNSKCKEGESFKPLSNAAENIDKNLQLNQSSCLDQTPCDGKAASQDMAVGVSSPVVPQQGKTVTDVPKTEEICSKNWKYSGEDEQKYENRFQKIAILSHPNYGRSLKKLENRKVKLILDDTLAMDTILDIIQKNMADVGNNALWILITGIYSVVDTEPLRSCENCSPPLFCILPHKDFTLETDVSLSIDTRLTMINEYIEKAQQVLGTSGILVLAPPLPAVVFKTDGLIHCVLHMKVAEGAAITKKDNFAKVEGIYNMYCTAMMAMLCSIHQRWIDPSYFNNFGKKSSGSNVNCERVYKLWDETMEALFESVLNQPYPNEDIQRWIQVPNVYDQVIIVGLTGYTGLLQYMTEGMPVIFLDETLDLNDNGLDVLYHLKTRWPVRTLWIVMVGISELAWPVDNMSLCSYVKCENPLPVFVTKNHELGSEAFRGISNERMVDIVVHSAFEFAARASLNIGEGSAVLMAPFIPQMGVYAGINCTETHEMLHMLFDRNQDVPFFVGSIDSWQCCAENLDYKWLSFIKNIFHDDSMPLKLIGKYEVEKNCLLTFINSRSEIDGQTIRQKWSKLMLELIDYFLLCKFNSPSPFKTSQNTQSPTTNAAYQQQSGSLYVGLVPAVPAIPFISQVQTSINATQGIPASGHVPPSPASMACPPPTTYVTSIHATHTLPVSGHVPPSPASVAYPSPSTCVEDYTVHFAPPSPPEVDPLPSSLAVVSIPSAPTNAIPPPISVATSLSTSDVPLPSPVTSNVSQKGSIVIKNIESERNFSEATELLKLFGKIKDLTWPYKGNDISGTLIMVTYEDSTHAGSAARILSFLKVFGANSIIKLIGKEAEELKLQPQDLTVLMKVHDFMKINKDSNKQNKAEDSPKIDCMEKTILIHSKANVSIPISLEAIPQPKGDMKDETGDIEVSVVYGGDMVPVESLNRLFIGLGAVKERVSTGVGILYHFKTYCAELKLLNDLRFPDKRVRVQIPKPEKVMKSWKKEMGEAIRKYDNLYSTIIAPVEELLKNRITREVNIYTFKTKSCERGSACKEKDICPGYHNNEDRRRCPLDYKYSADMCTRLKARDGCYNKDRCLKAHSSYEKLLHFHRYKISLCKTEELKGSCKDARRLCYNAHEGEPDMFYHVEWKHLYVEGLEKTIFYLRGAIMNLYKFPKVKCPRVLLVTPSKDMAKLYLKCISDYAASCGLKAVKMNSNCDGKEADVIITTLKTLKPLLFLLRFNMDTKNISLSRLKALIIDEGPAIFSSLDENDKEGFNSFGKRLLGLNVVVTAEKLIDSEIETAKESLNLIGDFLKHRSTNLKEESPTISQKESSSKRDGSSESSASVSIKKSKSFSARSPKKSNSQSSSSSTCVSSSRSLSKSNSQSRYRSKSSRSPKRSKSPSSKVSSRISGRDEIGKDMHRNLSKLGNESCKEKLSGQDGNPGRKRRICNVGIDEPKSKLTKKSDDGKSQILEERRAELIKLIEELNKEHDRELKLFTEVPEIHPSYEKSYSDFIEKYKKDYPGSRNISHSEKMWKACWERRIKELVREEFRSKFKNQCENLTAEIWYLENQSEERDSKSPKKTGFDKEELFLTDEGEDVDLDNLLQLEPSSVPQSEEKAERVEKIITSVDKTQEAKEDMDDAKETKCQKVLSLTQCLLSESSKMEEVPWWMHSLTVLSDACASLGSPVSSLLKVLIEKLQECGPDKTRAEKLLVDKNCILILEAVSRELEKGCSNAPDCQNFKLAYHQAMKLLEFRRVVFKGQEKSITERDEELNIQYSSTKTQGTIEEPSFPKSSAGEVFGCKGRGRLSTNIKMERNNRIKTDPLRKSNEERIPPKDEQNTEESLEQLCSELDCLKDNLFLLEKMEPGFQLVGLVASMLIRNMQSCWLDKSKLFKLLREADTQSTFKQIYDKAKMLLEDPPDVSAAEKFYEKGVLAKKLLDISRAISLKMDFSLGSESSEVGLHCLNSARISSEAGNLSTCSQGKFSSTSPAAICSNSSQPPQFSNHLSVIESSNCSPPAHSLHSTSQVRFSNHSPPTKSKEIPLLPQGPNESAGVKQTSTDLSVHSVPSIVHGLDQARSSDGRSSRGLPQDFQVTDKDFSSLEEICSDVGLLGPVALALFKEIRACWSDRAKVTEILRGNEKKALLELISGKARNLSEEATSEACKINYQLASITISKFLDFRKLCDEDKEFFGLDVSKIARLTFNKGSHFTVQYIKSALFLEGIVNPSQEDLVRISEAVNSLHFSMAIS